MDLIYVCIYVDSNVCVYLHEDGIFEDTVLDI